MDWYGKVSVGNTQAKYLQSHIFRQSHALAGGSVSGHFLYKYPGDYASAEHTGMMNDGNGENNEDATGTVAYICDVIENNYKNIDETTCDEFFNHYLGYRNIQ